MNCPYCAEILAEGIQFCPKCGNKVVVSTNSPSFPPLGEPQTSGKAIGSLIAGLFFFFFPAAAAAVILGHMSNYEIRKSGGRLKGHGMAVVGLVLGYLGISIVPVLIIAAIAIPNLLRARMAANEASAVGSLRTYTTTMMEYAEKCPQQVFPSAIEKLGPGAGDCEHANLLSGILGTQDPTKAGYVFHYQPGGMDEQGRLISYTISADPVTQDTTGTRHFFVDQSGVIRAQKNESATAESPALR